MSRARPPRPPFVSLATFFLFFDFSFPSIKHYSYSRFLFPNNGDISLNHRQSSCQVARERAFLQTRKFLIFFPSLISFSLTVPVPAGRTLKICQKK